MEYAETAIIQSGHSVVGAKVGGNIWKSYTLDYLMQHYEQGDPTIAAQHDKLIQDFGAGIVKRDTVVWMNYDIVLDVVPFPTPAAGGGSTP